MDDDFRGGAVAGVGVVEPIGGDAGQGPGAASFEWLGGVFGAGFVIREVLGGGSEGAADDVGVEGIEAEGPDEVAVGVGPPGHVAAVPAPALGIGEVGLRRRRVAVAA
jgi:hypothetical protein